MGVLGPRQRDLGSLTKSLLELFGEGIPVGFDLRGDRVRALIERLLLVVQHLLTQPLGTLIVVELDLSRIAAALGQAEIGLTLGP